MSVSMPTGSFAPTLSNVTGDNQSPNAPIPKDPDVMSPLTNWEPGTVPTGDITGEQTPGGPGDVRPGFDDAGNNVFKEAADKVLTKTSIDLW